jgi:hypothetical protein
MVKDYKRLHHLDFADADLDDSDGGYSDYQMSEHEAEDPPEKADSKELLPGQYQWQSTFLGLSLSHETGQSAQKIFYIFHVPTDADCAYLYSMHFFLHNFCFQLDYVSVIFIFAKI